MHLLNGMKCIVIDWRSRRTIINNTIVQLNNVGVSSLNHRKTNDNECMLYVILAVNSLMFVFLWLRDLPLFHCTSCTSMWSDHVKLWKLLQQKVFFMWFLYLILTWKWWLIMLQNQKNECWIIKFVLVQSLLKVLPLNALFSKCFYVLLLLHCVQVFQLNIGYTRPSQTVCVYFCMCMINMHLPA